MQQFYCVFVLSISAKGSKMAKLTAQKIFEIEQEVNKLDTSRFSVVSEVQ